MVLGILLSKEVKNLDKRYCVKFIQFGIGLISHFLDIFDNL